MHGKHDKSRNPLILLNNHEICGLYSITERVGVEPTHPCGPTRFRVTPLHHLSTAPYFTGKGVLPLPRASYVLNINKKNQTGYCYSACYNSFRNSCTENCSLTTLSPLPGISGKPCRLHCPHKSFSPQTEISAC